MQQWLFRYIGGSVHLETQLRVKLRGLQSFLIKKRKINKNCFKILPCCRPQYSRFRYEIIIIFQKTLTLSFLLDLYLMTVMREGVCVWLLLLVVVGGEDGVVNKKKKVKCFPYCPAA